MQDADFFTGFFFVHVCGQKKIIQNEVFFWKMPEKNDTIILIFQTSSSNPESKHIHYWLTDNCFDDYYARNRLDYRQRELPIMKHTSTNVVE